MTAIARIPVFLALGVGAWLAAQTGGRIGAFEDRADVGNPALKGTAEFDAAKGEYRLTGAGANIWANADQFCYVWRRLSGNVRMQAEVRFLGAGKIEHRKAGLMLRKSLDGGSPYVDVVVHGSGLTSLQFREKADDITREFQLPADGAEPAGDRAPRQPVHDLGGQGRRAVRKGRVDGGADQRGRVRRAIRVLARRGYPGDGGVFGRAGRAAGG